MDLSAANIDALERQYEADGFVKIDQLLSEERLQEIERELARYATEVVPTLPPGDIVWESELLPDGSRSIRNLWRMDHHSKFFADLLLDQGLSALISRLVHGTPVATGIELFAKPARVGSAVPYHQDNAYFTLDPPDSVTCWIALDNSSEDNGCVYYGRGTHLQGLRAHMPSMVQGNSMKMGGQPAHGEFEEVPGFLTRGGAILHHCLLVHRSEPNRSDKPRRGLLIVYKGAHCKTDPVAAKAYQQGLAALKS